MNNLTQEDYKNILALISKASIVGAEAMVVAILQQKISALITAETKQETKTDEKNNKNVK